MLTGVLQQAFGSAFASTLVEARHYHKRTVVAGNGDVTRPTIVTQSVKAFREITTDRMREAGYRDDEARLIVMQTYEGRVITRPVHGDVILLEGERWVCGEQIDEDAAHVAWFIRVARQS